MLLDALVPRLPVAADSVGAEAEAAAVRGRPSGFGGGPGGLALRAGLAAGRAFPLGKCSAASLPAAAEEAVPLSPSSPSYVLAFSAFLPVARFLVDSCELLTCWLDVP